MALYALPAVYGEIRKAGTTIVFVNTRAQADLVFRGLWRLNAEDLSIAVHHGSLEREQRRRVEAAMARGDLRAVVATSSLDLGIDWGAVDLMVQMGAPKGSSRMLQRIGRANHRLDQPSRALLVPGSRFEVLECRAVIEAIHEHTLDGDQPPAGALDVLAQHMIGTACSGPFTADALYAQIRAAAPYCDLDRRDFDDTLAFAATGGYALCSYERYRRLKPADDGAYAIADKTHLKHYSMNVGTIVAEPMLKVRLGRGRVLGEVEEHFAQALGAGRYVQFCRPAPRIPTHPRHDDRMPARSGRRSQGAGLRRHPYAAHHTSRRSGAGDARRAAAMGRPSTSGARVARAPGPSVRSCPTPRRS